MTEATEVEVTQADREEAASYYYSAGRSPSVAAEIRDGKKDTWFRVQAFARHRISAITQAGASLTAEQKVPVLLEAHFKRMQEACANYVEPTTYIARHPIGELCKWNTEFPEPDKHQSIDGALATTRRRDAAFINDIIYMLDGPEQRASIAQAQEPE